MKDAKDPARAAGATKIGIDQKGIPHGWLGDPTDKKLPSKTTFNIDGL
jgi:hypothetical protein